MLKLYSKKIEPIDVDDQDVKDMGIVDEINSEICTTVYTMGRNYTACTAVERCNIPGEFGHKQLQVRQK